MKTKIWIFVAILALIGTGYVCVAYYPFVFSKAVKGKVLAVEQVTQSAAIIQGAGTGNNSFPNQVFSFAVEIQDEKGEIFTASSEDRRWAVVKKGQCAEARFFRYPPWNLEKSNTFFGARLEKVLDCN